jgi:hypothetical protein
MEELEEAFAPCTPGGLTDALWDIIRQIAELRRRKEHLERVLIERSTGGMDANAPDCPPYGTRIEGEIAWCRAAQRLNYVRLDQTPVWTWELEVRKR